MKLKFKNIFVFLFCLLLLCCKKEPGTSDIYTVENYSYIIHLTSDLKILSVEYYIADSLNYKRTYNYKSDMVELITTYTSDNSISKSKYFINNSGLADSCIDSTYCNSKLRFVEISRFRYNTDGYKISTDYIIRTYDNDIVTQTDIGIYTYELLNGNVKAFYSNGWYYYSYEYSSLENKIDIISFLGDYAGKKNANLMKFWYDELAVHYALAYTREYNYTLNSDGYVTECMEIITTDQQTPKEKRITKYEYIFQ